MILRMSLLRVFLITAMLGCGMGSAEESPDFVATSTAYPGGITWYVAWESTHARLTYKVVGFPEKGIDPKQLGDADRFTLPKDGTYLMFNEVAALIRQLPDQKTLPDDGRRVFDGYGVDLSTWVDGRLITVHYNNPDDHCRIMDAACVGIITRIEQLVRDAGVDKRKP